MWNRRLWIILLVALVVRLGLLANGWAHPDRLLTPDSRDYLELGSNLSRDGNLLFSRRLARFPRFIDSTIILPSHPYELFRTPGYPAFLRAIGVAPTGPEAPPLSWDEITNNRWAVNQPIPFPAYRPGRLIVQVLLDVVLVYLVFLLGRALCSERVGLVAAAIQAITPVSVVASVRVLSGSLFALLLIGSILLLVWYLKKDRKLLVFPAGILLGLACLVRPIGGPFAVIVFVVILAARWRRPQWVALFLVGVALCVGPWIGRNYACARYPGLSTVGAYNLFFFNAMALVDADPEVTLTPAQQALCQAGPESPAGRGVYVELNSPELARQWQKEGLAIIGKHPFRYAWLHLRTTMNTFMPAANDMLEISGVTKGGVGTLAVIRNEGIVAGVRHYFNGRTWPMLLAAPLVLITLVKYVGVILGAVKCLRWKMGAANWLVLITIAWFALVPGPVAQSRFRVPIAPLLSIVAAAGFVWVMQAHRARRSRIDV